MIQGQFSHYEVLEQIGAGGMGQVYRARDLKLGREVALKILPSDFAAMPQRRERFLRESQLAAQLSHPRIATIFEADEVDGQLYYAMELIRGETLESLVRPGGLSPEELVELAIPLTEGLAAAHHTGVVHRDLKPTNVMLDEHGRLKILDFGLSRLASDEVDSAVDLTQSQQLLGTPQYMSPEQVRGGSVDTRSDLFSLGAMLYELATGLRPFLGRTQGEVMESVLRTEPPPLQRANPRIGDDLARVIGRLLEKDQARRVQTADDLLAELRTLGERIATSRPTGRRWLLPASAVAVVLAVALYVGLGGGASRDAGVTKIAVLPFHNLGATSDEYFADGTTDAITARLAGIRGLGVISRQSAMQYKNSAKSPAEIAAELGVDYLLEGTIQRENAGDPRSRVRVIPQLIRVADDTNLWAATYDEEGNQVFRVQSEIAERVARALDIKLLARERSDLESRPTDNLEAYDFYLRGNDYLARGYTDSNLRIAIQMFERATELDPRFALAFAVLCRAELYMYWYRYDRSAERVAGAKRAVDLAEALDPDLPEVHLALGQFHYHANLDYERALAEFAIARRATPGNGSLVALLGYVYRRQGNLEQAVEELETAMEIDPRNIETLVNLGSSYMLLRRFEEAGRAYDRAIALLPEYPQPHARKAGQALFGEGDPAKAQSIIDAAMRLVSDKRHRLLTRTSIEAAIWAGDHSSATAQIEALSADVIAGQYVFVPLASFRGLIHELAGEADAARQEFESARETAERHLAERPEDPQLHAALGIALAHLGRTEQAILEGRRAVELMPIAKEAWQGSLRLTDLAHVYATVGEHDLAIDLIEQLLAIPGEIGRASLAVDPRWIPLRAQPRFRELTK